MTGTSGNGFSDRQDVSMLAERLQVDSGAIKARARDPHAELKTKIHRACIARLGAAFLNLEGSDELQARVRQLVNEQLSAEEAPFSPSERARLERQIADDILGYGPLEPFLHDPTVTEIMVNGYDQLYVERSGRIEETEATFLDDAHLLRIIDRIVSQVGRRIDESSPMVDARLPDGSRVNAIIPPLALRGPSLTIRKFARNALSLEDLIGLGNADRSGGEFSRRVRSRKAERPHLRRYGHGEDDAPQRCSRRSCRRPSASSRSRTPPSFAAASVTSFRSSRGHRTSRARARCAIRDLVRNALRMRPDRIIVGEVRGAETLDMLQAMNTGHDGSLTTLHANSATGRPASTRDARLDGRCRTAHEGDSRADRRRLRPARAHLPARRRLTACHPDHRDRGHGG